eukprot:CAMPEP_0171143848 /NCGR_PEP_ID=MMETSP0766_2-20121228/144967_1 /TAXON_ID=439317 /ORGANISM="Gambierdiscus australes, Strain CAWD 149" /LENGTH=146 /DNA_ID=CAMNT_0011607681 /DNA_START=38 /DNA_END=475 /DNA_ORIENTATION=+
MLAVRNVPWNFTYRQLEEAWAYDGSYNYIHLPFKVSKRRNVGYVFVNFTTPQHAAEFADRWHGCMLQNNGFRKALNIAVASIQSVPESMACLKWEDLLRLAAIDAAPLVWVNNQRIDARLAYVAFGLRGGLATAADDDDAVQLANG